MQSPGSNPDIPSEAEVTFREQWDRAQPGTKRIFGQLDMAGGRRLIVFPHREWRAPLGVPLRCVLYPVRNAAVAAPVGGIPETEQKPAYAPLPAAGGPNGSAGAAGPVSAPRGVDDVMESVDQAYSQIADGLERLDEALNRLDEMLKRARVET